MSVLVNKKGEALAGLAPSKTSTVVTNNGLTFSFYKQGHLAAVTLASGSATSSVTAGGKLVDIPNGYKPCAEGFQTSIAFGHTGRALMLVGSGIISIQDAMSAGATPRFSITYICE